MGYSPYTIENIDLDGLRPLNFQFGSTITAGSNTAAAIVPGKNYTIFLILGDGDTEGITIDVVTGEIKTTKDTAPGFYVIGVRNNGSYNVSIYYLTVLEDNSYSCCDRPTFKLGPNAGYDTYIDIREGNILMETTRRQNLSYDQLMKIRKAQSSKK